MLQLGSEAAQEDTATVLAGLYKAVVVGRILDAALPSEPLSSGKAHALDISVTPHTMSLIIKRDLQHGRLSAPVRRSGVSFMYTPTSATKPRHTTAHHQHRLIRYRRE